jgi:imidazolonepropionase-like amidohydrolase
MRAVNLGSGDGSVRGRRLSIAVFFGGIVCLMPVVVEAQQPAPVTVFEGARLIVGDGSAAIEDSAFIVQNGHFTTVGRKAQLKVPAGATHVDLTGKTVMPAIIDAHKHLAVTRDALVDQLQHLATTASAPR